MRSASDEIGITSMRLVDSGGDFLVSTVEGRDAGEGRTPPLSGSGDIESGLLTTEPEPFDKID